MADSGRRTLGKLLLVLTSIVVTLLVLEGVFRIYFAYGKARITDYRPSFYYGAIDAQDRARFTSHPFLPYAPRPHDSRTLKPFRPDVNAVVETNYTNNSLGFRTPDRPFQKPLNTKRVVTLGGSTTVDGPTNDQTWSALLEKRLNERYASTGQNIEVINLAVDAAPSGYSLVNLALLGLAFQPDLVISYDGVNDTALIGNNNLSPDYRTVMGKFDDRLQTLQVRLPRWVFASHFVSWATHKFDRAYGSPIDLMSQIYPPQKISQLRASQTEPLKGMEYFERNLRLMRAMSEEYGARFMAATAHWVKPSSKVEALNDRLRKFFAESKIEYLDLDRALPHDDWTIHVDAVHWSLRGEEEVAHRWANKIVAINALNLNVGETSQPTVR